MIRHMVTKAESELRRAVFRKWRDAVWETKGWRVSDWSRAASSSEAEAKSLQNAVSNFLTGRSGTLSYDNYKKLGDAIGVSIATMGGSEDDSPTLPTVIVAGEAGGSMWHDTTQWPVEKQYRASAKIPAHYKDVVFGLELVGPDIDQEYPVGTALICVPVEHFTRALAHGDLVICRRQNDGQVQQVPREYQIDSHGQAWLSPKSDDPRYRTPSKMDLPPNHPDHLDVVAVVIGHSGLRANIV